MLEIILKSQGYDVMAAQNGKIALEMARINLPGLVISDILMPVMDGYQLCIKWKKDSKLKNIPFIFNTASYIDEKDEQLALKLGADSFIRKPVKPDEFIRIIQDVIRYVKKGRVKPKEPLIKESKEVFQLYSERLVKQLESKNLELSKEITERKRAHEIIRKSEERHRMILQTAMDGFWLADIQGRIIEINEAYCRMSKYSKEELLAMNISDLEVAETSSEIAAHIQKISTQGTDRFETQHRRKDGSIFDAEISVQYRSMEDGLLTVFIRDITERKKAEEEKAKLEAQLQQSQKLESIGTLAGGVAHEINNPINGIMNYAQLIIDKLDPNNPVTEFADEIIHETKRVATIVRNLLTFAREEKQTHSPARLIDIIDDTMSLIQTVFKRDQISLEIDVPEDLPKIRCRSQQIQQVIMNLATNARDALNEKYSGYDENKKIIIFSNLFKKEGKDWIRTTVEDHGAGIDADIKERLFDPFFTTKQREIGTGLGLSISYGIVKGHHGDLSMESEPGQYTKFHIDLPVDNSWELEKDSKV
jgi:PAS domain S-box-containing protein